VGNTRKPREKKAKKKRKSVCSLGQKVENGKEVTGKR